MKVQEAYEAVKVLDVDFEEQGDVSYRVGRAVVIALIAVVSLAIGSWFGYKLIVSRIQPSVSNVNRPNTVFTKLPVVNSYGWPVETYNPQQVGLNAD